MHTPPYNVFGGFKCLEFGTLKRRHFLSRVNMLLRCILGRVARNAVVMGRGVERGEGFHSLGIVVS